MSVEEPDEPGSYWLTMSRAGLMRVWRTTDGYYRVLGGRQVFTWSGLTYQDEVVAVSQICRPCKPGEGPGFDGNGSPVW